MLNVQGAGLSLPPLVPSSAPAARPVAAPVVRASTSEACVLAARIRDGDAAAFEQFFMARYAAVTSYLTHHGIPRAVAEELAQDVFLRVWQIRDRIDPDRSLTAYIFRAARNTALNHLGRERRERRWLGAQQRMPEQTAGGTDHTLYARELSTAAAAAIARLPDRCRIIFLLSRQQGLTYREIAASLSISIKTVETQMGRAIKVLSQRLADHI